MDLNCEPKGLVNQLEEVRKTLSRLEYYLMAMAVESAINLVREIEAIKKQEPECWIDEAGEMCLYYDKENAPWDSIPLYSKPVYQHSFSVDGHTFYADNEVDILYLERKFGVGGKAKLTVVDEEHF